MDCATARESLSARIDGEREPVPADRVDAHLDHCASCCSWYVGATELTRRLGVRAVSTTPDLTGTILSGLGARAPQSRAARMRQWAARDHPLRVAIIVLGTLQMLLGIAQLAGVHFAMLPMHHDGAPSATHLFNETTAWTLAVGAGLIAVGVRPSFTGGLLPVLLVFTGILAIFVVVDALAGEVTLARALSHLLLVAAVAVVIAMHRHYRPTTAPPPRAADRAVPSHHHIRWSESSDPAA